MYSIKYRTIDSIQRSLLSRMVAAICSLCNFTNLLLESLYSYEEEFSTTPAIRRYNTFYSTIVVAGGDNSSA